MAKSSEPKVFDAVAGHVDRIFYGRDTPDGQKTLRKETTAWEVLHYLAMNFGDQVVSFVDTETHPGEVPSTSAREKMVRYVAAIQGLRTFTPPLFAVRLPVEWTPTTAKLRAFLHERSATEGSDMWYDVHDEKHASVWALLFVDLFTGALQVTGDGPYDAQVWGLGLVDVTSDYTAPAVMDVKVGYLRYSRVTPARKVKKIQGKDEHSLLRKVGLRIGGLRRVIQTNEEKPVGCQGIMSGVVERESKALGYAIADAPTLRCCLRSFFSTQGRLAVPVTHSETSERTQSLQLVDRQGFEETEAQRARLRTAEGRVRQMLRYFGESPEGEELLSHFAVVAASVLCVYDAADKTGLRCNAFLIDLAMSTWRELNYGEEEIGFLAGLANFVHYLS